jgi:hypothetical protein
MKKNVIVVLFLSILIGVLFFSLNSKDESIVVASELIYRGETANQEQELLFSIQNISKKTISLEFPTFLEYNLSIEYLSGQSIPDRTIQYEHLDLNPVGSKGRTVLIKPNEKLEYRLLIKNMPPGDYGIWMGSAAQNGEAEPVYRIFTVK